jgi:hypothetical protein
MSWGKPPDTTGNGEASYGALCVSRGRQTVDPASAHCSAIFSRSRRQAVETEAEADGGQQTIVLGALLVERLENLRHEVTRLQFARVLLLD